MSICCCCCSWVQCSTPPTRYSGCCVQCRTVPPPLLVLRFVLWGCIELARARSFLAICAHHELCEPRPGQTRHCVCHPRVLVGCSSIVVVCPTQFDSQKKIISCYRRPSSPHEKVPELSSFSVVRRDCFSISTRGSVKTRTRIKCGQGGGVSDCEVARGKERHEFVTIMVPHNS